MNMFFVIFNSKPDIFCYYTQFVMVSKYFIKIRNNRKIDIMFYRSGSSQILG